MPEIVYVLFNRKGEILGFYKECTVAVQRAKTLTEEKGFDQRKWKKHFHVGAFDLQ